MSRFQKLALPTLVALLSVALVAAASVGAISIPPLSLLEGELSDREEAIFFSVRLPRMLLAVLVGAALAVSGAAMQGLFRNPLADPGLIGIAAGAALSVAVFIVLGDFFLSSPSIFGAGGGLGPAVGLYGLSAAAFLGGLATCLLIFRFARLSGRFSVTYMLLAGIAVNALAGAGVGFLTYLSDDQQLRSLAFWTMGSLGGALWPAVLVAATVTLPAIVLLVRNGGDINILLLGDHEAEHLGINGERLRRLIIICTAFSVGAAVAVSGIIGFVGLVVPHLIRLTIGPDHRLLIPASALLGALLLLTADTVARTVVSPAEMPVGILTSMIGGPFFLWLLAKQYAGRLGL